MEKGMIINIQKFSIHDGPGIRTTVFFKGCPLKCRWCANPESQSSKPQILWDDKKCTQCQSCLATCKQNAIKMVAGRIVIDHQQCDGCLDCIATCPTRALSVTGQEATVASIVDVCLQDRDFYEESNGGVTISGGEPLLQPLFLESLTNALKEKGIQVAVETTGYARPEIFQQLAPLFDLLLFDVKHYDSTKHQAFTAVENKPIIANLQWARQVGLNILPRIPVIPGFNDSLEDARNFAFLFKALNITKIQLLPFHQFGEGKYASLNVPYLYQNQKALHREDLQDYCAIFREHQIDCFF